MTRAEAKAQGLMHYQGRPCLYGHSGIRRVGDSHCVECKGRKYQLYYAKHGDKIRAKRAVNDKANPEQHRERVKRWQKKVGRDKLSKAYRDRNPFKTKARDTFKIALRQGLIVKQPCVMCGEIKVEAHHSDYAKPLEVTWLCSKHHLEIHGAKFP